MAISKKRKAVMAKYDFEKLYNITEAVGNIKNISTTTFDASVDVAFKLGIDPKKSDQMIRSTVSLPHGTGKDVKILVICNPTDVDACLKEGADHAGSDEYFEKIKGGWTDIDVIICHPSLMGKLGPLGKTLGPKGLMPNPKSGTVATDVVKAVKEFKAGKVDFRIDKYGIVHVPIGKASFEPKKLEDNFYELYKTLLRAKPSSAKGVYFQSISISASMSPAFKIETSSLK